MKYKEITIYADDTEELAKLDEKLSAAGYDELLINDPGDVDELIGGSWGWTGSIADRELLEALKSKAYAVLYLGEDEAISAELSEVLRGYDYRQALVDDEDWLHKWEEYYVPFNITPDIVVKPVWREYEKKGEELVIEIDPGLAFGTGSSPTTYLCARLLEKYLKPGMTAVDAGCGTGILSVIASKLGAASVEAFDIDPEAVLATENNAKINSCSNIRAEEGDLFKGFNVRADMVIANLLAPLVMYLSKDISRCSDPGTILIASGIIDDMEKVCLEAVKTAGFEIIEIVREDCWTAFAARLVKPSGCGERSV